MHKLAKDVTKADRLIAQDGEVLAIKSISKGVTVGGVCFEHKHGYSEVHRNTKVEIAGTE